MSNRLINETSPYLQQHADNPVDWYPWGPEALKLAQEQDKPILLSIGYAACHWCHVMAHESFEDEGTAVYMNTHFINIKVDREERPDIDSIYMQAVVALTGQGGWPMTVFLTPDGRPFYGGTYYPPVPRYNMPSFIQIMQNMVRVWTTQRQEVEESAGSIAGHLQQIVALQAEEGSLKPALFDKATAALLNNFDSNEGGFGNAPKFPPSMSLEFLLRVYIERKDSLALNMVETTLQKMAYGGLYDQLGGGFARYSTDDRWLVPHFEKMLYDNALLTRIYLHAYQVTDNPLYKRIVAETLDFVIRELRHESGGFYSSYDADSEGVEGKFYVWSADEIRQLLGEDATLFMQYYDVTEHGNWEGSNILNMLHEPEEVAKKMGLSVAELESKISAAKQTLINVRNKRIWPGLDDKVLTAWNGLMLASFAEAGRVLNRPDYTAIATQNAQFLYDTMRDGKSGRLLRTWKEGKTAKYNAYLEDYAYLADGLLALYQTTFDEKWFVWAKELTDMMLTHFTDTENGGFFDTSDDHETLIHRPKDIQDNATPSGNSMAAGVLLKLGLYTGNNRYWDAGETAVSAMATFMEKYPSGFAQWLSAAWFILSQPQEVAIIGDVEDDDTHSLLEVTFDSYRPNFIIAIGKNGDNIPLLADRPQLQNKATAYLCKQIAGKGRRWLCFAAVVGLPRAEYCLRFCQWR